MTQLPRVLLISKVAILAVHDKYTISHVFFYLGLSNANFIFEVFRIFRLLEDRLYLNVCL